MMTRQMKNSQKRWGGPHLPRSLTSTHELAANFSPAWENAQINCWCHSPSRAIRWQVKDAPLMCSPVRCGTCNTAITFTDDDLLLSSKPHNHSLFVTRYIQGQKVNQILVHGGSAVNIRPKSTMNDLGITIRELSNSRMMIQAKRATCDWYDSLRVDHGWHDCWWYSYNTDKSICICWK